MSTTFGIEEEFMLLDPASLRPVELGPEAVDDLGGSDSGAVAREFFRSQVEFATPVCESFAEARAALLGFRRRLGCWAAAAGVVAAGTGTPFRPGPAAMVSADERYERIASDIGGLAGDHQINGLHVHVGIPDRDAGIRASNALRPWLPVLLALSGNSPFWNARETGYDSWRAIHSRRWTTNGIPPRFRDAAEYDRAFEALMGIGATSDAGALNWVVRLSARFPTVEVRICDAQLDASSSAALAAIVRALVTAGLRGDEPGTLTDQFADAALWHAARDGVGGMLVHPLSGRLAPAGEVLRALHDHIAPALLGGGETCAVERLLERRVSGAQLQRAARRRGTGALAALYRERLAGVGDEAPAEPARPPAVKGLPS
ncbi:carboxylate-amine ligase [Microbacterium mangrovi]|uniref:carboxylate-amine ligase n=1 Tax=Microbacterium mangrovi TaxID=1348253 RepID=UPI000691E6A3|nr:YbdK family carboxylate-amine ligase [Microbacterium mangrovi]